MNERLLKKHDVMISYSTKTKQVGDDVREILSAKGYDVWMAPESIPSGECYDNEIFAAIESSDLVLFLMSESSLESRWCKAELKYAVNVNKRVLPVRIDDVEFPYDKLGKISCILGKRQIYDMFPEYERKLHLVEEKVDALLHSEESVPKPYPVVSAEMQDLDSVCIGRQKETKEIADLLLDNDMVNVYGFGGMGKTCVVKKFFSDYFLSLPYVTIHVAKYNGSAKETIAHVPFVGFNESKYLSELRDDSITKEQALFDKKCEMLSNLSSTCLLIVDGMDYADQSEVDVIKSLGCHKIVVSRNRYDDVAGYEIGEMLEEDLIKFFEGVVGFDEQKEQIKQIISHVGKHTLTVSLIASYCREFEYTPQEVLDDGVCDDLEKYDSDDMNISDLLDKIPLSDQEIYCLKVLSLFPNGISKGKVQKVDREVVKTAQKLVKKNLVIGSSSTYQLHQIVRELVYEKYDMSADSLKPFLDTFLDVMRKLDFEENQLYLVLRTMDKVVGGKGDLLVKLYHYVGNWVCDYAYVSLFHVNKDLYKKANVCNQDLNNTKRLHFDRFEYAEQMQNKALALAQKTDSDYARHMLASITSMTGAANYNMNKFARAFECQKKALALAEQYLSDEEGTFHAILSRLGLTAIQLGEYDVALESFSRLYDIEARFNFARSSKANIVYRLGLLYKAKQDWQKAKDYFVETLEDDSNPLAESDYLLNLAEVCLQLNQKEEAKEYYLRGRQLRLSLMETDEAAQDFVDTYDKIYLG
ncbi:MAG: TIR domain-containing protein [Clostridia bacterium]|nr:TIR domain-containing protein [Clostridia bacterium]